jgi:molybdopterin synthase catalytic subunit
MRGILETRNFRAGMTMTPRLQERPLDLDALLDETANPRAGALVVFAGTVRDHHQDKRVTRLEYSAYGPLAEKSLAEIQQQACSRFDILECRVLHRLGDVGIGEVSVYVVVRSVHRAEAFEAARWAIDTIKHRVSIWKREEYDDGTHVFVEGCPLHQDAKSGHDGHEHPRGHAPHSHE